MTKKSKATLFLVSSIIIFLVLELIASAFYFQIKGNYNLALFELSFNVRDKWFSNSIDKALPLRYIRLREHRRFMHKTYGIPDDSIHK